MTDKEKALKCDYLGLNNCFKSDVNCCLAHLAEARVIDCRVLCNDIPLNRCPDFKEVK